MWMNYSMKYIKQNKWSSIFIGAISFIAATLLSLICGVFYNLWIDRVQRQYLKTGNYSMALESSEIGCAFVLVVICGSLIVMIHNAFEVSMSSRLHQLGILQSVGATPGQLRTFLLQEAIVLCVLPILAGVLTGIALCYGFMQFTIFVTRFVRVHEVLFRYHILVAVTAFMLSVLTVFFSAWIPAKRMSRMTPLTAIHYGGEPAFEKIKSFPIASGIFGIYGELAAKSLYTRRTLYKTSALSLILAFLGFISFLNLEVMSGISTQHTYFERFRDKWDILLTTTDMQEQEEYLLDKIKELDGVETSVVYKKIRTTAGLSTDMLNEEVLKLGISNLTDRIPQDEPGNYRFEVLLYVLDDDGFEKYISDNHIEKDAQVVAVNTIWDSMHSTHTNREYVPLLDEESSLNIKLSEEVPVSITAFTNSLPNIRESFEQYSLSLVIPQSLYHTFADKFSYSESYYNIHIISDDKDELIQEQIHALMQADDKYLLESRSVKENAETSMRTGLKIVIGCLSGLLACIGIANVFSATLGQIYQRKKEFARYLSIGLSPTGMKKILFAEALLICLRPVTFSFIINIPLVIWGLNMADISINEFIKQAPCIPIMIFTMFVLIFVGIAYYIGGRKICNSNLADILRDETMI